MSLIGECSMQGNYQGATDSIVSVVLTGPHNYSSGAVIARNDLAFDNPQADEQRQAVVHKVDMIFCEQGFALNRVNDRYASMQPLPAGCLERPV